jgi:hypothetical protein
VRADIVLRAHALLTKRPRYWTHDLRARRVGNNTVSVNDGSMNRDAIPMKRRVDGQIAQYAAAARIGSISVLSRRGGRI